MNRDERKQRIETLGDEDLDAVVGGQTSDGEREDERDNDYGGDGGVDIIVWDVVG